ncbi:MAG: hypothetical protein WD359_07595 [Dehalococcoidia bacterium]
MLRHEGRLVIIDGIWNDDDHGQDGAADEDAHEHPGDDSYTDDVMAALPLTQAESVDDVIRLLEWAGFGAVRRIDLTAIDDAEGHLDSVRGRYGLVAGR